MYFIHINYAICGGTYRDTIQRARYVANDKSYTEWPPCLRIFHPFGDNVDELAFEIADCIEKTQLESFEISLSEWSIIPHAEAMECTWWRSHELIPQQHASQEEMENDTFLSPQEKRDIEERKEFEALVRREEELGRQKLRERRIKAGLDPDAIELEGGGNENTPDPPPYLEFDGPCVLCLEPDLESQQDLMTLRQVLQQYGGMAKYSPFCPTATADPSIPPVARYADFRAVIPIASFSTVTEAIPVAQKLRKLWEPLTWEVTDLHILSRMDEQTGLQQVDDTSMSSGWILPWKRGSKTKSSNSATPSNDSRVMGCSALIALYGEEMEMDEELNAEVANLVAKTGIDGGFSRNLSTPDFTSNYNKENGSTSDWTVSTENLNLKHGKVDEIEAFLADDEDDTYDEGTVMVFGRVSFFTGDACIYAGMPAQATSLYDSVSPSNTASKTANATKTEDAPSN